jgi:hypothetical protein
LETVLNLVWISVSLGLLLICGSHVLRGGEDRRRAIAAVALLCLVCLLFPVISATDDINAAGPALVETNKFKRFAASAPAALALLRWPPVQLTPRENRSIALDLPAAFLPPLADAFSFPLNRRPPPSPSPAS